MATIQVEGHGKLKVLSSLGYVHDVGALVKEVQMPDGSTPKVVRRGGAWHLWTARDKLQPGSRVVGQ